MGSPEISVGSSGAEATGRSGDRPNAPAVRIVYTLGTAEALGLSPECPVALAPELLTLVSGLPMLCLSIVLALPVCVIQSHATSRQSCCLRNASTWA